MSNFLTYIFWPNPGGTQYDNPKVMILLGVSAAFVLASIVVRLWRRRVTNSMTKKLSGSWAGALAWFGIIGLVLTISRVEMIGFVAMRFWWFVWAVSIVLYVLFQVRQFRARHYQIIPSQRRIEDEKEKYLPKPKK